jgi:hypothetical protein
MAVTIVQAFDGIVGALDHDPPKTYGVFALAGQRARRYLALERYRMGVPLICRTSACPSR